MTAPFDKEAWEKAYQQAGDLPPEPVDFSAPDQVKDFLQGVVDKSGAKVQVMSGKEAGAYWKQQEINLQNLILAELGDDTVVRIANDKGKVIYENIGKNKASWPGYMTLVTAYKRKGDLASVAKLMEIFPEHSQLQAELKEKLNDQEVERGYKGFDPTIGKVVEVTRGNQYDLLPGTVDFRRYVEAGRLGVDRVADALFQSMKAKGETVYAEDWDEPNHTLDNIRKEFGDDVFEEVWRKFSTKYRDHLEASQKIK